MPLPTDPMLAQQWHLSNPTPGLLDLNVFGVWAPVEGAAYTGAGVRVVVIDDGFDYNHVDLAPNYDTATDFDFSDVDNDPFGVFDDAHGTAVTGIIGAAANGTGTVGVAYDVSLVGYRIYAYITDFWLRNIRDAIHHAALSAVGDVVNISQGIANDASSEFGVGYNALRFDEIETSIGEAVDQGRGGLGTTIVKSAGNSRGADYDVNADDWTNDTRQVVVAAVDQNGFVSSYSSYGAAVLVSGFGTPGEVVTTDRTGTEGYDNTDYTSGFNGTSSAAPMVTGVVSLMLEANAGLGWRDVQGILAASARHVGSAVGSGPGGSERYDWGWNASTTWNGGGMHFSNDYGYGLVDARAAVRLAESWLLTGTPAATSANQSVHAMDVLDTATLIPADGIGGSFSGTAVSDDLVDRVTVQMTFATTYTGDVVVYLISPDGTVSVLIDNAGDNNDYNGTWTFESQAFRGERAAGTWTVQVFDAVSLDPLTVSDVVIRTYGTAGTNDRHIFTDEYSDYAGIGGHSTTVNDANGGTDTANAAAVTSDSLIRLDGVAGNIDGVALTIANIEHAIGGDGDDTIYGNTGANQLFGMRGADHIHGGSGTDSLYGGDGNDTLSQDPGGPNEIMDGGAGTDTGDWSFSSATWVINLTTGTAVTGSTTWANLVSIENVVAGSDQDNIFGNSGNNLLEGGIGHDTLDGGIGGIDTLRGGEGNDIYRVRSGNTVIDEIAGQGSDTIYAATSFLLAADDDIQLLGTVSVVATTAINLSGNSLGQVIMGNAGNNALFDGGAGGNDTMHGLDGNDVYRISNAGTVIFEMTGNDTVYAATSYVLGATTSIERLGTISVAATTAINLTGNQFAQTITGNAGNNILSGNVMPYRAGGNDTMHGFAGNDTYRVFNAGDVIVENAGQGNDTVYAAASFALSADDSIEWLGTSSAADVTAINLSGNALAQTITGNAGNNALSSGAAGGNDTMHGFGGNDIYRVYNAGDVIVENAGQGSDTVYAATSFALAADDNIERLGTILAAATTAINLTGNTLGQIITGNAGVNRLDGGLGNDTMFGFGGTDTFVFSTALGAGNVDRIEDFLPGTDTIELENTIFTGLAEGVLSAAAFAGNAAGTATDALTRIIYKIGTGELFFDADGTGAGGSVLFAVLDPDLAVTESAFLVV